MTNSDPNNQPPYGQPTNNDSSDPIEQVPDPPRKPTLPPFYAGNDTSLTQYSSNSPWPRRRESATPTEQAHSPEPATSEPAPSPVDNPQPDGVLPGEDNLSTNRETLPPVAEHTVTTPEQETVEVTPAPLDQVNDELTGESCAEVANTTGSRDETGQPSGADWNQVHELLENIYKFVSYQAVLTCNIQETLSNLKVVTFGGIQQSPASPSESDLDQLRRDCLALADETFVGKAGDDCLKEGLDRSALAKLSSSKTWVQRHVRAMLKISARLEAAKSEEDWHGIREYSNELEAIDLKLTPHKHVVREHFGDAELHPSTRKRNHRAFPSAQPFRRSSRPIIKGKQGIEEKMKTIITGEQAVNRGQETAFRRSGSGVVPPSFT